MNHFTATFNYTTSTKEQFKIQIDKVKKFIHQKNLITLFFKYRYENETYLEQIPSSMYVQKISDTYGDIKSWNRIGYKFPNLIMLEIYNCQYQDNDVLQKFFKSVSLL